MTVLNVAGKLRGDASFLGITGPLGDNGRNFLDDLSRLLEKAACRAQQILPGKVIPFTIERELVGIDPRRAEAGQWQAGALRKPAEPVPATLTSSP